jgi:hypothetical protein
VFRSKATTARWAESAGGGLGLDNVPAEVTRLSVILEYNCRRIRIPEHYQHIGNAIFQSLRIERLANIGVETVF